MEQNYSEKRNSVNGFGISYYLLERQISFLSERSDYFRIVYAFDEQAALADNSQVYISYYPDYQDVKIHKISIIRNGKVIDALNADDIVFARNENAQESLMLTGKYTLTIPMKGLQQGDVVDYSYSINGQNPIMQGHKFFQQSLGWRTPLNNLYLKVLTNDELNINITRYKNKLKKSKPEHFQYELKINNIEKYSDVDLIPESYEYYPYISGSGYDNWNQVSKWGTSLFDTTEPLVPELLSKIKVWEKEPDSGLLNAIKFVQDEIRYFGLELGVNSHQPHQPNDVFRKKFGDCKDKVLLLNTILKELGFEAKPMLVSTSLFSGVENQIPSPYAFNHVISLVEVDGKEYFIDPTQRQKGKDLNSLGHLPYGKGLVISDATNDISSIEEPTYSFGTTINETYTTEDFREDSTLNIKTVYSGLTADNYRGWYKLNNIEDMQKSYLNFYKKKYPEIERLSQIVINDNESLNKITVEEEYKVKDLWEFSSKYYYRDFYSSELRDSLVYPKVIERNAPLKLNSTLDLEHNIKLVLPKNINLSESRDGGNIAENAFRYEYKSEQNKNVVKFKIKYKALAKQVGVKNIKSYLSKLEEAYDKTNFRMVVNMDRSDQKQKRKARLRNLINEK